MSVALAGSLAGALWLGHQSAGHVPTLGFWFEPITYTATPIGGAVTPADLDRIEHIARAEVDQAFAPLRVALSDRHDATYRVAVVSSVRDPRFGAEMEVAGASRAVAGFGGGGTVSFAMLAGHAIGLRPEGTDRAGVIDAIGRGIGRAAVHEFAHQLLPTAPMHGPDRGSYEYGSASRREQYYGPMHWDIAWPMLEARVGRRAPGS